MQEWLQEQLELIAEGLPVKTIRIEGENDFLWSTVLITDENTKAPEELLAKLEGNITNIVSGLPAGRHILRLVAVNSEGHPVSVYQHTVQGNSLPGRRQPTIDESVGRVMQSLSDTMQRILDANTERAVESERTNTMLHASLRDMHEAALLDRQHFSKLQNAALDKEAKREAIHALVDKLAPVGVVLLGECLSFFQAKNKLVQEQLKVTTLALQHGAPTPENSILPGEPPNENAGPATPAPATMTRENDGTLYDQPAPAKPAPKQDTAPVSESAPAHPRRPRSRKKKANAPGA